MTAISKSTGCKLRGNAVYNAFFTEYLGAQVIDLPTTEVYSGLERGVVDATGWTQIGLIDLKWNEFLNYRIEPCFFSTDLGVIVNLESWNGLGDEARRILQETAIQHEIDSVNALRDKRDDDFAALDAAGMKVVTLEGEAKANYLAAARETTWARMKELMEEEPMGVASYDRSDRAVLRSRTGQVRPKAAGGPAILGPTRGRNGTSQCVP